MSIAQPHLEIRKTGYFWRRRVPAAEKLRFKPAFFCFPLKTHVPREAAELARRLTAISDLCFNAGSDVSPETMTDILTQYARLEIETADRLRALTGPRTRQAAEAAVALEAAARASLRDAIYLCDKAPALTPIQATASRLGIAVDQDEENFAILADKMIRLMIEISSEKVRRSRGEFSDTQPYLSMALANLGSSTPSVSSTSATSQHLKVPAQENPDLSPKTDEQNTPTAGRVPEAHKEKEAPAPFLVREGLSISVDRTHGRSASSLDGTNPRIVDLWQDWFDENSRGVLRSGAYTHENEGKAARFKKNADTISSTGKLVRDVFGETRIADATGRDWCRFNDMLLRLPNNHGRSSKLAHLNCFDFTKQADQKERKQLSTANRLIGQQKLKGDEAESLLREARIPRIAPRTYQRHQKYLSAPLDRAVERGLLSHNPFKAYVSGESVISEMRKGCAETKRKIWTSVEYAALLSTTRWSNEKTEIDDEVYWVPLIARLHGLRSEEILQLKPKNIRRDDGVDFFDIERGTGQSAKSENARRMIPIHSQLIELGFLELVELQRKRGKTRIFNKATRSKSTKLSFSANFTKKFNYYRKSRNVYNQRQDLHSMRTTFNTKCVTLEVPDTARRYLMGHRNDDVGIVNYLPEGFPLSTLKKYIEQQRLDLSMITRRFGPTTNTDTTGPRLAVSDGVKIAS